MQLLSSRPFLASASFSRCTRVVRLIIYETYMNICVRVCVCVCIMYCTGSCVHRERERRLINFYVRYFVIRRLNAFSWAFFSFFVLYYPAAAAAFDRATEMKEREDKRDIEAKKKGKNECKKQTSFHVDATHASEQRASAAATAASYIINYFIY